MEELDKLQETYISDKKYTKKRWVKAHFMGMDNLQEKNFDLDQINSKLSFEKIEQENLSEQQINEISKKILDVFQYFNLNFGWGCCQFFETHQEHMDYLTKQNQIILVKYEERILGIVQYKFQDEAQQQVFLDFFGILPEFQNKRLGGQIMTKFLNLLKSMNVKKMEFRTDNFDSPQAMKFYEKFGFQKLYYKEFPEIVHYQILEYEYAEDTYYLIVYTLDDWYFVCKDSSEYRSEYDDEENMYKYHYLNENTGEIICDQKGKDYDYSSYGSCPSYEYSYVNTYSYYNYDCQNQDSDSCYVSDDTYCYGLDCLLVYCKEKPESGISNKQKTLFIILGCITVAWFFFCIIYNINHNKQIRNRVSLMQKNDQNKIHAEQNVAQTI